MAKHLTRIPVVDALPDVATYDEGFPLLYQGVIYTLQDNAGTLEWTAPETPEQAVPTADVLPDASAEPDGSPIVVGGLLYVASGGAWVLGGFDGAGGGGSTEASDPYAGVFVPFYERYMAQDATNFDGPSAIAVQGNFMYTVAAGLNSFLVFDISDKAAPAIIGSVVNADAFGSTGAGAIEVHGHLVYVAGGVNRLSVVDVSDPTAPAFLGAHLDDGLQTPTDLVVRDGYAFVTAAYQDRLVIVDVSDPAAPALASETPQGSEGAYNPKGLALKGDYAFVGGDSSNNFDVFDISDPTVPAPRVARLLEDLMPSGPGGGVAIKGDYAFYSQGGPFDDPLNSMLVVIDISDPLTPTTVGSLAMTNHLRSMELQGDYLYFVMADDEATDSNAGFAAVDISDPLNPELVVASALAPNYARGKGFAVKGEHLYWSSWVNDRIAILG